MSRLVLLVASPRVAAGLASHDAWQALAAGPVMTAGADSPWIPALAAAGISAQEIPATSPLDDVANRLLEAARLSGAATWLVSPGEEGLVDSLHRLDPAVEVEILHGNWDLPGARLLDVVATMDRLRSPGGCPWDARQDHETLAPYLLEEAYEAFQTIEDRDWSALRDELGDVLLQVVFHARMAEEADPHADEGSYWSIDDVAAGLVEKLVRRHPHVFATAQASTPDEVSENWEAIKAAERGGASPVAGVAMAAPALTLAATLQRKATRHGVEPSEVAPELAAAGTPAAAIAAASAALTEQPSVDAAGALLWTVVAVLRGLDIDAETALRARSRTFRESMLDDGSGP